MKLVIVHFHLRPGGIRRVIELATPHLLRAAQPPITEVILATGEAADPMWISQFRSLLGDVPFTLYVEPTFCYFSEQQLPPETLSRHIRSGLDHLLTGLGKGQALVWAHNLGIARNLLLTRELARVCRHHEVPLLAHHHDWWFDNRWLRWPELRRAGFRTLPAAAHALFPANRFVRHLAINHADASILKRFFPRSSGWLPNLMEPIPSPTPERLEFAREWLQQELGAGDAPVWLLPCRFLRRKNVAEALLLTRWLRPEAWLALTGPVSSADERFYHDRIQQAARQHGWPLRIGLLQGPKGHKPSVPELLAVSEAVLLTSIQEGFGLPFIEAAAAGRPLLARKLPGIFPDLKRFGFAFPHAYDEILIHPELFEWDRERAHQQALFDHWKQTLPRACRDWVGTPALLKDATPRPVPFCRLTLQGQLEVLAHDVQASWQRCAPLNPFLNVWRRRAREHRLRPSSWPTRADEWLSGAAYARRFFGLTSQPLPSQPQPEEIGVRAQAWFMRKRLDTHHLFPLLWSRQS